MAWRNAVREHSVARRGACTSMRTVRRRCTTPAAVGAVRRQRRCAAGTVTLATAYRDGRRKSVLATNTGLRYWRVQFAINTQCPAS